MLMFSQNAIVKILCRKRLTIEIVLKCIQNLPLNWRMQAELLYD